MPRFQATLADELLEESGTRKLMAEARAVIRVTVMTWGATVVLLLLVFGITVGTDGPLVEASPQVHAPFASHAASVWSVTYSPSGKTIASASMDGTVQIWDVTNGWTRSTIRVGPGMARALAISPDGKMLAVAGRGPAVAFYDASSGEPLATIKTQGGGTRSLIFSPDGQTLVSAGASDGVLMLFDVPTRRARVGLSDRLARTRCATISSDGRILAGGNDDGTVTLWDAATGKVVSRFAAHNLPIVSLAFSPDGHSLATAAELDPVVRLWNPATGRERAALRGHSAGVTCLAFAPGGSTLATAGGDGAVKLWDPSTARAWATLQGHSGWIWSIGFAADGMSLVSGGGDHSVRLWNIAEALSTAKTPEG